MTDNNKIILFESSDGEVSLETHVRGETVWLSKEQMGQLFDRDRTVISRRIRSIFNEKELSELDNVQIMHIVNSLKPVEFYSLDVIISVGYRVKSQRGVEFRKLATSVLRDYIIKGYAENKRRLNQLNQIMSIN